MTSVRATVIDREGTSQGGKANLLPLLAVLDAAPNRSPRNPRRGSAPKGLPLG